MSVSNRRTLLPDRSVLCFVPPAQSPRKNHER